MYITLITWIQKENLRNFNPLYKVLVLSHALIMSKTMTSNFNESGMLRYAPGRLSEILVWHRPGNVTVHHEKTHLRHS